MEIIFLLFVGIPGIIYYLLKDSKGKDEAGMLVIIGYTAVLLFGGFASYAQSPVVLIILVITLLISTIMYVVYKGEQEKKALNRSKDKLKQNCEQLSDEQTEDEAFADQNYKVKYFLIEKLRKQYPYDGLEHAISSCVKYGVLINRSNGEQYDVMLKGNRKNLNTVKCVHMITQDKIWDMRQHTVLDKYLPIPVSEVPLPSIDMEIAPTVRRDAVIRYILVKKRWDDVYIKQHMLFNNLHIFITPRIF